MCIFFAAVYREKKRTILLYKRAIGALIVFFLFRVGGELLKSAIASPRPCWDSLFPSLVACPNTFSFPSGHALGAFFIAMFLGLLVRKKRAWILGGILAFFVGWSRVAVGVHTPVDVIGGAIIGSVGASITWRFYWNER